MTKHQTTDLGNLGKVRQDKHHNKIKQKEKKKQIKHNQAVENQRQWGKFDKSHRGSSHLRYQGISTRITGDFSSEIVQIRKHIERAKSSTYNFISTEIIHQEGEIDFLRQTKRDKIQSFPTSNI